MIESAKKHWLALFLALVLGALMVLPFFYFETKLEKDFKGILPEIVNDSYFYYARIKDVIDGHSFLSNAYLFEHKGGLPQQLFLAEYLLAQPLKLFSIGINTARLIYNFLLPAIAFILAYSAFYLILKKRSWALTCSSFLFFGLYLLSFIRPVSPQFNFIFWLTQFIFLWLLISKRGSTQILADQRGKKTELLYKDITYKIRGACFKVWEQFRGGFNVKVIERALVAELINMGLTVENQKRQDVFYYNQKVGTKIFDIVVNNAVLIELKSLPFLTNENKRQFWTYLKKSSYKLGLLINFGNKLQIERKIFDQARQASINADKTQIKADSFPRISASYQHLSAILLLNVLNFGLLFYIYPYYWTFYLIFFLIFVAFDFASSKYFHNSNYGSKKIIKIVIGGLVLAIPYFYLSYLSSKLPYYTETLTRLGLIYTRFPSGIRIIFWSAMGLATFSWFLYRKIINWNEKTLFFISGILASVIAVNQHLVTGRNLEFSSHYDMAAIFFLVFALAYLIGQYNTNLRMYANDTNKQFYFRMILVIIILVVTFYGLSDYSKRAFVVNAGNVYQQNYASIFEWLNKNTEKDSVVYANNSLSGLIPVYTANNVFYHRNANLFFISDQEVLDRFILNNFFEDFNKDFIIENVRSVYGNRYVDAYGHVVQGNKLKRLLGIKLEPEIFLPDEAIERVVKRAAELQKNDFTKEIKKYRVDYLVWDKNKNPEWRVDTKEFIPVFESGDLAIFRAR